jgi:hypothetical protein
MNHLDLDLDLAFARARDLAFARARDRDLDLALDLALDLDRALARVPARVLDRVLARVALARVALDRDLALDRVVALARALARDLALVRALDLDRDRDRVLALARARRVSVELVGLLEELVAGSVSGAGSVRVAVWAGWLVGLALRVVPVGERGRYGEEWRGELWDLAGQGGGRRRRQTVHAVRTLACAWSVRSGVREGRRRPAGGG